jgi:hypothetical protein
VLAAVGLATAGAGARRMYQNAARLPARAPIKVTMTRRWVVDIGVLDLTNVFVVLLTDGAVSAPWRA